MVQRIIFFAVFAIAIINSAFFATILLGNSPYTASSSILWSFFVSLFIALSMWLSLLWYGTRRFLIMRRMPPNLWTCIRQSTIVSMIICLSLFFNTLGIFQIWDVAPLAVAAILIEFFFQAEKKPQATIAFETPNE